jgi:hypothetical protein
MVISELIKRSEEGEPYGFAPFAWGSDDRPSKLLPWDVPAAQSYINAHPDHTSYHLLCAIRRDYPRAYRCIGDTEKASILCAALTQGRELNEWGILKEETCLEGEPAKALVETGTAALPFLSVLLDDKSPRRFTGSIEATMSHHYRYRVADFAHRYICLILGWEHVFHPDPTERDMKIDQIKARLEEVKRLKS